MTMIYSAADVAYLDEYRKELANQINRPSAAMSAEPVVEVPDYGEAERIWKLLVAAAQG
jgi:hypothetical protein